MTVSFNYLMALRHRWAGGWSLSGVGAYSTGYPISVYYGTNPNSLVFNGGLRPNLTGDPILVANNGFDPNVNSFLTRTAFVAPAPLAFGNAPVFLNTRQPSFRSESFGVFKDTRITERATLQFRTEMSNPFN